MPELPEVETIARGLDRLLRSQRLGRSQLLTQSVLRHGQIEALRGQTIARVHRRGKFLIVELDGPNVLLFHLKMTGRVWVTDKQTPLPKHTHLLCDLEESTGQGKDRLIFEDLRRFGFCAIFEREALKNWPAFARLGPEPLESTAEDLASRIAKRRSMIKAVLLDQTVLAGVGNIYADESLFAVRIHPASRATDIPLPRLVRLGERLQRILLQAIDAGGSTISDYRNAYGKSGLFQERFQVYGKKGQPCPVCAKPLQTLKIAGRTSTHCPSCQIRYTRSGA